MTKDDVFLEMYNRFNDTISSTSDLRKVYKEFVEFETVPINFNAVIMLEPDISEPIKKAYDGKGLSGSNCTFESFNCVILVLFRQFAKQSGVLGITGRKGTLKWERFIKDTLTTSPYHMGGKCRKVEFGNTAYMRNIPGLGKVKHTIRFVQIEVSFIGFYSTTER